MRTLLTVVIISLMATASWAGLGLPNEAVNPGFELTSGWEVGGPVSQRLAYSTLQPYGVPKAPTNPGNYCGGFGAPSTTFPGGYLRQVVDESLFPGWVPGYTRKIVEVDFWLYQKSLADVPMNLVVYLDWMTDLSYPDPQSPLYVKQKIAQYTSWDSGGWKFKEIDVELPCQPRWLSLEFEFTYFSGTGVNIIDNVDLQGKCIPEPSSLLALGAGLLTTLGIIRRRR